MSGAFFVEQSRHTNTHVTCIVLPAHLSEIDISIVIYVSRYFFPDTFSSWVTSLWEVWRNLYSILNIPFRIWFQCYKTLNKSFIYFLALGSRNNNYMFYLQCSLQLTRYRIYVFNKTVTGFKLLFHLIYNLFTMYTWLYNVTKDV